jgi:hypothetical protein
MHLDRGDAGRAGVELVRGRGERAFGVKVPMCIS